MWVHSPKDFSCLLVTLSVLQFVFLQNALFPPGIQWSRDAWITEGSRDCNPFTCRRSLKFTASMFSQEFNPESRAFHAKSNWQIFLVSICLFMRFCLSSGEGFGTKWTWKASTHRRNRSTITECYILKRI